MQELQQFTTDISKLRDFTETSANNYLNTQITELQQALSGLFYACGGVVDANIVSNVSVTSIQEMQQWLAVNQGAFIALIREVEDSDFGNCKIKCIIISNAFKAYNYAQHWQ